MTVLVVDYGMGNLHSVSRALESLGAVVQVSSDPVAIANAERVVLPGVGSFAAAMSKLHERGWVEPLRRAAVDDHLPFLGICLGMQLLAERGVEGTEVEGLGLVAADVVRLEPRTSLERVPHVGWNDVKLLRDDPMFTGVAQGSDFYFVHSYRMKLREEGDCIAEAEYCGGFPVAVRRDNVVGVQFHPEKSSRVGMRVLQNFVTLL